MINEHWLKWSPRPLGMLVSVISFLYSGIIVSTINGILIANGIPGSFVAIDSITQNNLMVILLGLGAYRSFDKKTSK
jgi:hypothetical protein